MRGDGSERGNLVWAPVVFQWLSRAVVGHLVDACGASVVVLGCGRGGAPAIVYVCVSLLSASTSRGRGIFIVTRNMNLNNTSKIHMTYTLAAVVLIDA